LADVATDKATMEVVGYEAGTLLYIGPKEGEAAPVNGIIAIVGKEGTDITPLLQDGDSVALALAVKRQKKKLPPQLPLPLRKKLLPLPLHQTDEPC
jgi:pyruvate/2-oxoglutarate dehydrogenase complex dihydrolipoamide acyltransferase (E2) component